MTERDSNAPVGPGDVLAGKYSVERVLGAGGMGVVVQARHLELEERVALKFLLPHAVESPEAAARFVREARAAVRIKSEHVARVRDVGRLENGSPYIVMEYLEGADLSATVQAGPIPAEEAVDFVLQACDAMAEAHAAGIVHRDLKPSNLFLTRRADGTPIVKVLDFGISKLNVPDLSDAALTKTQTLMGSPFYMSPEQMRSAREVDHRTDVWSLGVILFELLSGTQPFSGETLPQLLASILQEQPRALRQLRADLPPGLEAVVGRALEKDRNLRFQSVGELAQALMPYAPRRSRYTAERIIRLSGLEPPSSVGAPALAGGLSTTAGVSAATGGGSQKAWAESQASRVRAPKVALAVGGAVLLVAALGGAAFLVWRDSGGDAAAVETAVPASAEPELVPAAPRVEPLPVPAEPAATPPAATPSPAPSAEPLPPRRSPAPKAERPVAPTPAPAPPPAPSPKKNPLSIELK